MAAPEPSRTLRRIRVLPRQRKPAREGERTLPEPPLRNPAQQISIILPLQREKLTNPLPTLLAAQPLRIAGHEVILVHDALPRETLELVGELVDQTVEGTLPVARQLNLGVRYAWGEQLLFLRAGCLLPEYADQQILEALEKGESQWGCFAVRFSGSRPFSWFAEQPVNWRSRLLGVVSGEQGIFMRRSLFEQVNGFPEIPAQETVALSRLLRRSGPPAILQSPLVVAAHVGR